MIQATEAMAATDAEPNAQEEKFATLTRLCPCGGAIVCVMSTEGQSAA